MPDPACQEPPDTRVFRTGLLPDGVLLPVTRPPVSSDMDVTDRVPATAPSSAVQVPQGPETEILPPGSDTVVTHADTHADTPAVTPAVGEASHVSSGSEPGKRLGAGHPAPERVAAIWSLEHVATHYGTSTRTIRRWIKDPAKAPVRLHALVGDDGKEAAPLQITGDLPPLRKSWQDEPEGNGETDTTAIIQTPREADLIEMVGELNQELHQQYREQISRLIAERDAERNARLEAEIRAALAEDRAVRVQGALDDATAASPPLLAAPSDPPRIGRLAHLWEAIRIG